MRWEGGAIVRGAKAEAINAAREPTGPELVIRRTFDAPRALVFKAWTERERLRHWFGPKGFTINLFDGDLRPGGAWRSRMRSPQGKEYPQHGVVRDVVEPERLVFTVSWDDRPAHEMLVTVALFERHGRTEMVFLQGVFQSIESRDSHLEGWNASFDRLEEYLAEARDEEAGGSTEAPSAAAMR
jgi:uncharacterized protein YndB with AHSA1/START domain